MDLKDKTYQTLYLLLNKLKSEEATHRKNQKIKNGTQHTEIEHLCFGLGIAERFVIEEIEKLESEE